MNYQERGLIGKESQGNSYSQRTLMMMMMMMMMVMMMMKWYWINKSTFNSLQVGSLIPRSNCADTFYLNKNRFIFHSISLFIIIMSCWENGYPWHSLATSPYRSSPLAGLQRYTPYPQIAAVCMFFSPSKFPFCRFDNICKKSMQWVVETYHWQSSFAIVNSFNIFQTWPFIWNQHCPKVSRHIF